MAGKELAGALDGDLDRLKIREPDEPEWRWCTIAVVRAYVGVTDNDWYRFLAAHPAVAEVYFWQPCGGRGFRFLTPGEPFFF